MTLDDFDFFGDVNDDVKLPASSVAGGVLLLDFSGIMISLYTGSFSPTENPHPDEIRNVFIARMAEIRGRYLQYKHVVFAIDDESKNYWRLDYQDTYKASRKKARKKSPYNFELISNALKLIRNDIENELPWKFIDVARCEADDIIGVIAKNYGDDVPVMIISSDEDFIQLQRYSKVHQYSPNKSSLIRPKTGSALKDLETKIIRGDTGDTICNIISPYNTIMVEGVRQKPCRAPFIESIIDDPLNLIEDETILERYKSNKKIIDLSIIPEEYETQILLDFRDQIAEKKKTKLMQYLMKYTPNHLAEMPHLI